MKSLFKSTIFALLSVLALGACSEEVLGPEPAATSTISGNWRGTWSGDLVTARLEQSGPNVTGTLTVGQTSFNLTGTIDDFGVFEWASSVDQAFCMSFYTTGNHLLASDQMTRLAGSVRRVRRVSGACGDPGGRFENAGDTMTLEKTS